MKVSVCSILFFMLFVLFSCADRKTGLNQSSLQRDSLSCTVRNIQGFPQADILELKSYYISSFVDFDSVKGMMAYNYRLHSLDLINVEGNYSISSIPLQREGPDGIPGRISGICPVSEDSTWVYDGISMYLINGLGKVCDRISFQDPEHVIITTNYAICTAHFCYDAARSSLLYLRDHAGIFSIEEYDVRKKCVTKQYPLSCSVVNPAGEQMYGDMEYPNINFSGGCVIYNYPYESSVYVLDLKSGESSVIPAESLYTAHAAHPCPDRGYSVWERHRIENVHYFDVMYLPVSRLFVRLHLGGVAFDAGSSVLSLLDSKSLYMSVFDKDFHRMGEVKLADKKYNLFTGWCALGDALLLFNDNSLSASTDSDRLDMDLVTPAFTAAGSSGRHDGKQQS